MTLEDKRKIAADYLFTIKDLEDKIKNKEIEIKQWFEQACSLTSLYEGVKVQQTGEKDKIGKAVSLCLDAIKEIENIVEALIVQKKQIIKTIESLPNNNYNVLHKYYIQQKDIKDIALEMDMSINWVYDRRNEGLDLIYKYIIVEDKYE